jgi:isopentenyldiphosphate isomerase
VATTSLTHAEILEHGFAIFKTVLREDPEAIHAMHDAFETYTVSGTVGTLAERREAVRLVFNFHWKQVLGHPHQGHSMKHYYASPTDVPDLEEPPA